MTQPRDTPDSRSTHPENSGQTPPFETSLAQLAELVTRLESGTLGLSDSISAYEQGVAILRSLHDALAAAEEKVNVLVRIDDEGRPILTPLPAESDRRADPPATGQAGRPRRASGRSRNLPGMDDSAESP